MADAGPPRGVSAAVSGVEGGECPASVFLRDNDSQGPCRRARRCWRTERRCTCCAVLGRGTGKWLMRVRLFVGLAGQRVREECRQSAGGIRGARKDCGCSETVLGNGDRRRMGSSCGGVGPVRSVCGLVGGQCWAPRSEGIAGCKFESVRVRMWDDNGKEPGVRGGDRTADDVTFGLFRNDVEAYASRRREQSMSLERQESIQ